MGTAAHSHKPVLRIKHIDPVSTIGHAVIDNQLNDDAPGTVTAVGNILRNFILPGPITIHSIPGLATVATRVSHCTVLLIFGMRFGGQRQSSGGSEG